MGIAAEQQRSMLQATGGDPEVVAGDRRALLAQARTVGPAVHDARIAALCLQHGVRELWSADRDFGRFPALKVLNPLV